MKRLIRAWVASILVTSLTALMSAPAVAKLDDTAQILLNIQDAARNLDYEGVFTYYLNDQMHSYRIAHRLDGDSERERLEALDNFVREFIRHDNVVMCVLPERKVVLTEARKRARFPALLMSMPSDFSKFYELVRHPAPGRVAGRDCVELELVPKDAYRSGVRICADQETGLLLKAQVLDEQGLVAQQVVFTQIVINEDVSDAALESNWVTHDWKKITQERTPVDLERLGWTYDAPPGFHVSQQTRRLFQDGREVDQLLLTDGLASISVFIEPYQGDLSQHQITGLRQGRSGYLYGKRLEDFWVMVVGDVPEKSLLWVADSIRRK